MTVLASPVDDAAPKNGVAAQGKRALAEQSLGGRDWPFARQEPSSTEMTAFAFKPNVLRGVKLHGSLCNSLLAKW